MHDSSYEVMHPAKKTIASDDLADLRKQQALERKRLRAIACGEIEDDGEAFI